MAASGGNKEAYAEDVISISSASGAFVPAAVPEYDPDPDCEVISVVREVEVVDPIVALRDHLQKERRKREIEDAKARAQAQEGTNKAEEKGAAHVQGVEEKVEESPMLEDVVVATTENTYHTAPEGEREGEEETRGEGERDRNAAATAATAAANTNATRAPVRPETSTRSEHTYSTRGTRGTKASAGGECFLSFFPALLLYLSFFLFCSSRDD